MATTVQNKFAVLFEVGTARVAGSVISLPATDDELPPVIVWEKESQLAFPLAPDDKYLLTKTLAALKDVAAAVHKNWPALTDEAHCVLASPFYRARTKISIFDEENGFTVTTDLLDALRVSEIQEFVTITQKPYYQIPGDKPEMLEYRLLKLESHGHRLDESNLPPEPLTNLELTSYLSLGSEAIIKKFKEIIRGSGHFRRVAFHSYLFAAAAVAGNIYQGDADFLLIDPAGERTDVGLIINRILLDQHSFASRRRGPHEPTPSREEWLSNLRSTLKNFSNHSPIPRTALLSAPPREAPIYHHWLIEAGFAPLILSEELLAAVIELAPGLQRHWPPGSRLPAIFIAQVAR